MNIAEIEIQLCDLVEEPFDRDEFVFKFMEIFNPPKATLTRLQKAAKENLDPGGDLFWPRKMHFRVTEPGQAANVIDALKDQKIAKNKKPRFIIATDGKEFSALDIKADETLHCDLNKLNDHFDFFLPLAGIDKYAAVEENPADIKAAGRLAKFHDEIIRTNPDWHTPEKRHALNQFMARTLFCLFSEDTGSFEEDLFIKAITEFGGDDGEQIQSLFKQIFDVMNVPEDRRDDVPAHINAFPYVNGGLFADQTEVPKFSKRAKRILIEAARLDWREINPDIFGSMIQAVVDDDMRGDLGMHYTSVPNIMKVLQPLFLMSLEEEFEQARGHREERSMLRNLLTRISKIRVFDPACGSGNFLIIAYRELRTLEMRIFQREDELDGGQIQHRWESGIKLSNFYGIELADFAVETAKLSLWIAEYQMNRRFKELFGEAPPDFPLKDGGHIVHGNALRLDWLEICPPPMKTIQKQKVFDLATVVPVHANEAVIDEEVETIIAGNPPYLGGKKLNEQQSVDVEISGMGKMKQVDYVGCWFAKAADYALQIPARFSFVATSSICQGEQVHLLWGLMQKKGFELYFAYEPFGWSNNAKKNAGVHCTIVGLRKPTNKEIKRLFVEGLERKVRNISPYLIEGPTIFVTPTAKPINGLPVMCMGSNPVDGKRLVLSRHDYEQIVHTEPDAVPFLKRYMGGNDFMSGIYRYCIWIEDKDVARAKRSDFLASRIEQCRDYRLTAGRDARKTADKPHKFCYSTHKDAPAILCPNTSASSRSYIPAGFTDGNVIINKEAFAIYNPDPYVLSLISSTLHRVWLAAAGGKLGAGFRYSVKIVYNNFPVPKLSTTDKEELERLAWDIIAAREAHPGKTIAWLYDSDTMPENLLAAHKALDDTLEKIYIGRPFKNDTERLEHLFKLYAEMTAQKDKEAAHA